MNSWKSFDETSLSEREDFYSDLNMEAITGVSYKQTKRIWNDFKIKNPAEYHDLHVQSDTLLLSMYLKTFKIYGLDPARYFLYPI